MAKKLRYRLFSVRSPSEKDMRLFPPGLFAWPAAFQHYGVTGEMSASLTKDSLEQYDVIHINYTPSNASYASAIREKLGPVSDTKLIANVDFGTIMWDRIDPYVMKDQLNKCDFVFHVEMTGAARLSKWLGRDVQVIPHPVDTEEIAKGRRSDRSPVISCQYHRYMNTWTEYFYGLKDVAKEFDLNLVLMNVETDAGDGKRAKVPMHGMFDEIIPRLEYRRYLQFLSYSMFNVDITHDNTYGRGVVDAAALGVPTVGSNTIDAARLLFGDICIDPWDTEAMSRKVRYLCENEDAREIMTQYGMERADYYSLEKSYNRMVNELEVAGLV
jgi:glycosyltransferase involved in cell wall biosynthesis